MRRRLSARRSALSRLVAAPLVVGALLAGAASGAGASPGHPHPARASASASAATSGGFPVSVPTQYGTVRIPKRPTRIVSLSPTATEMLFAIGAGHQVVAVDDDSDYPASAPRTSLSGYTPNVEAIAKYRPDLVVISYNPSQPDLVRSLELLGIPTLYLGAAANLKQTYGQIATLGRVTGERSEAQHEIATMRSQIASLVASVPHRAHRLTYFYELSSSPLYTATADTFIGSVLSLAGLRNVAGSSVHGSDYPQFSSEVVVRDNPTFVFLADGASLESIRARPGWSSMSAVRDDRVVELDEDIASRWGPRIVDLLRSVVQAVDKVPATTAG